MQKFAKRYRAFMVRSALLSKLGCVALALLALAQLLDSIEIAGPARAVDLEPAVLKALVLEALVFVGAVLRYFAVSRVQFIPLWVLAGSWLVCVGSGVGYVFTVYGGVPWVDSLVHLVSLGGFVWAFIVFGAIRFFITAAMAYAVSLDDVDSYS